MNNTTFFFGAGAETCFNLPQGAAYTVDTILTKKSELYKTLAQFYKNIETENDSYAGAYRQEYLFSIDSTVFYEIILGSLKSIKEKNLSKELDEKSQTIYDEYDKIKEDKLKPEIQKIYEEFVSEDQNCYVSLKEHCKFYGSIERYFSAIINPKEAGEPKFWKLVNYFWSAYFSIMIPLLASHKEYKEIIADKKLSDKYKYILDNLVELTEKLWSNEAKDEFVEKCPKGNYYKELSKRRNTFQNPYVITTNYTPYAKSATVESNPPIYLAGKLSLFENPDKLELFDLSEGENLISKYTFPFLMTQALVKPIVFPQQIEEFAKAQDALKKSSALVIIGYSLCENDNHINAIIRKYCVDGGKIIYCKYNKNSDGYNFIKPKEEICKSLKLDDEDSKKIEVIPHTHIAEELFDKLEKHIQNAFKEEIKVEKN